ncbi:hypothetical protein [Leptospira licerasiae]|uniref:hypothetical protein n=1 Tax=Leptospira licerasiae TaxID=447106 RepID=UPI001FEFA6C4|nr:hypothetical protein [Leptospira licerasiae]
MKIASLFLIAILWNCASSSLTLKPYEPKKHCKEPIYLPNTIPDSKAVSAKGVRDIEKNNRDCLEYIQAVVLNNTEYAEKNRPNSFKEDFTIFAYGVLTTLILGVFLLL